MNVVYNQFSGLDKPYGYIYLVTNQENGKFYIGQTTKGLKERWKGHIKLSKRAIKYPMPIVRAISSYGPDCFSIIELDRADSKEELDYMERHWIKYYRSTERSRGYNLKNGGANGSPSPEVKSRISKTLMGRKLKEGHPFTIKGKTAPMKGKTRTPESNKAHGELMRQRHAIPNNPWRGRIITKARRMVLCVETGQIFSCLTDAACFIRPDRSRKENRGLTSVISLAARKNTLGAGYHWIISERGKPFNS